MSVINTNITSMIAQQNLSSSKGDLTTAMERLSSGLRINSAKDDAAGQAIANRMSAQITGLSQAQRNANDGISVAQTAEGALNQINDNLQRVRELTVQAQNGTNSEDDLTSIQNEIGQRLNEINRISEETSFNGVKVLQEDNSLKIQVGANDGEAIEIDLKQINAETLGLNGFNVDGGGVSQNEKATITDIQANGGVDASAMGGGEWGVVTEHEAATFEDVLATMQSGNTVEVDGTTYTFDSESGNFSFTNNTAIADAAAGTAFAEEQKFVPATGTKTGTYEVAGGDTATFEITSTGEITLDGKAAYISATGELTNNNGGGTAATIGELVNSANSSVAAKFTIDGTTYTGDGASGGISFTDTATSAEVATALSGAAADSTITVGDGFASKEITIGLGTTNSTDTYVDGDGELTDIQGFRTEYNVDADTGEVSVAGVYDYGTDGTDATTTASIAGSKYEEEAGAVAYVSGGQLTTSETTAGDATEDPLAALDTALKTVDALRSDLGAIQNRFDSAITNLSTTETNLSAARSRIEDADYATEVANMTRSQILQQAGTSVLAQANQLPQSVLSLLG